MTLPNKEISQSLLQHASGGGRWTAFSAMSGFAVQLAQLAILGRLLGPADFGLMAMILVTIGLFSLLADLGVSNFIVQAKTFTATQFGCLLILCVITSSLLAGVLLLLSPWIASYYRTPTLVVLLPATAFIIAVTAVGQIYFALLQREMLFRSIAIGDVLSSVLGFAASVILALLGKGIWALIIGQWVGAATKVICYGIASNSILSPRLSLNISELNASLRFGTFQMGERLLNYTGWNIDKLIIGRLLGETSMGIYSVAYQLVIKPFSVLNPIFTRVAFPLFSRIQDDDERLRRGFLRLSRTIAAISFPIYVVLIVASEAIIHLLLGPKWKSAADLLRILGVLGFVFALGNPIGTILLAKGRADLGFYYNIVTVIVYSIFIYIGSQYGLQGVAIGFVFAAGCVLFPLEFLLRWHLIKMHAMEYIFAIGKIAIAALLAIIFARMCVQIANPQIGMMILGLLQSIVALVVYSAFLWFFENRLVKETYLLIRQK